jgi:hypothetical protein
MLLMPHSCLIIKEDVIMKETVDDVDKYVKKLKKIDKHFEPVLEQNKLYDYLFHLLYYTAAFERIEDRWCPYKYLTKIINQIINDENDVGVDVSTLRIKKC